MVVEVGSNNHSRDNAVSHNSERVSIRAASRQAFLVLVAILRKEAVSRIHHPLEALLALAEPLMLLLMVCFAFYFFSRRPPFGTSVFLFMATGFLPYYFFIYVSRRMKVPKNVFPVERSLDYVLIHLVLRMFDYLILGILVFMSLYWLGTEEAFPTDMLPIIKSFFLLGIFSWGFGIINTAVGKVLPGWHYVFPALARLFIMFSGVHFVVDFLPPASRYYVTLNPLSHAIELFRRGFYPQYPQASTDENYLMLAALTAVFLGLLLEAATSNLKPRRRKF